MVTGTSFHALIIFHPQVFAKSLNSGLIERMRLSFFSRRQPLSCFSRVIMGQRPTQGDEKSLRPATTLHRTVALSFVIPSEAEGSAAPRTFPGNVLQHAQPL